MPLHRRLPKRGFNNIFRVEFAEVNLDRLQQAIDAKLFDAKDTVNAESLVKSRIIRRAKAGVRLLGRGELKAKLNIEVHGASKSAIAAVEKAGGTVKILAPAKEGRGRGGVTSRHCPLGRAICTIEQWTYRSRAPDNVRHPPDVPPQRGMTARAPGRKPRHGLSSRTTFGKPQFLGARQGRRAQEAHLVHAGRAPGLPARHLIPLPGIDPAIWDQVFQSQAGGILGMFNMFAGGGIHRMAIFALNIMPYISASIIIQLLTTVSPQLEALKKEGEAGRKTLNQYTRYLTVLLAAFQSYGIAVGLEGAGNVVADPGLFFRLSTAITLTGGTMFLMWLGEQITSRGIGNGISLIILSGIVAQLPTALANMLELGRQGALSTGIILVVIVMAVAVIAFIVFMERAQRRLLIQYPKRQVGNKMFEGQSSHLPLKLNTSGVIPPIFASSLLLLPTTVANFNAGKGPEWFQWITTQLGHGRPLFLVLYLALIVFFAFFYTAIVFNPTETADNLKKHGGFIPGIRPGERTAEYIDYVLSRITVLGAIYLAVVCLIPEILISYAAVPFYFGGTSLLIVVSVTMDTVAQVQGYLLAHQYEGLIRKSKLRGRRR